MKKSLFRLFFLCFCWCSLSAYAALDNGVYSISCPKKGDGFVALGEYQNVSPYICYVKDGSALTEDAYWVVTQTQSGYTFRNEASGQYLIFTTGRIDAYYKGMTLADSAPDDQSHLWYVQENEDGSFSINSVISQAHYWNLRYGEGLLGTYSGSWGSSDNEQYVFTKKGSEPTPGPGPDPGPDPQPQPVTRTSFPAALHVFLTNGGLEAYPLDYVTKHSETDGQLVIETNIGQTFTYPLIDVASVSETAPTDFPTFESFKFNNKFNDQLFTDADGEMVGDTVFVTIAAIGKRLTPSFKLPNDQDVEVYLNNELQESKVSRPRFENDVYYVVTRPGYKMLLPNAATEKGATTYSLQPYGRIVRVHVDWLTDRAEVPTIYIDILDGSGIDTKEFFKDATIRIDGHDIFPSMEETAVQVKGRGNSSWGWPKKPFRLKFAEKVKPLGMTKGKNWVLLSNYQTGSMMSNAIGMKAANLMHASAANHIVPVDIYINGAYRGSYNLTEKIGFSNNSVDLDDEDAAALLELDSYYDAENGQKFRTEPYNLPINVKEPEFAEGTTRLTLEDISSNFNAFLRTLYWKRDISKYVDVKQLARFMMVNELIINYEFYHPKSTFCYRESFESDTSKYVFGPVWDLDWAFGYERNKNYFQREATNNYWIDCPNMEVVDFIRDLRFKYEPLSDVYQQLWEEFMEKDLTELLEYCQDYYDFAKNSFIKNRQVWSDNTDYATQATQAAEWLSARSQAIYDDILSGRKPDIPDPGVGPEEPEEPLFADNKLYTITCRRGGMVLNEAHTGLAVSQGRTDAPEEDTQFAILNIEGKNYIYSPVTGGFLNYKNDGNWVYALGSPIHFSTENADGEYLYTITATTESGGTLYFNNSGKQLVINSWDTPDDGDRWLIEEAGDFDPTDALELAAESFFVVTNRILFNGQVIGEETQKVVDGSMPPAPSSKWENVFTSLIEPEDIPYAVHDDVTIDYEANWTGPFTFSTSDEDATWYNMTIRSDYFVCKQETEPYIPIAVNEQELTNPDYHWAFGGNPYKIKVYNRSTGFTQTLTNDGGNAVMRAGDYEWDLLSNSDGFVLRVPGTEQVCLNQIGGRDGTLQTWDNANSLKDNGSTFRVMEALDAIEIVTANDLTMVYGDDVPTLTYNVSGIGLSGTPKLSTTATRTSPVGTYPITIERGTVTDESIEFVNGTLTITPALLTIGVQDETITEGDAIPTFTLTYNGFKNNDNESTAFSTMPKATTTATAASTAGTYPITVSDGTAPNYTITYGSGTLTIKKLDIFIVTYQVMFDNQAVAQATQSVAKGQALPEPPAELSNNYITLEKTGTHPTTVTKDVTVTFTAKWSGPFQFSKQESDAKWYNMTIRNDYHIGKQDEEPYYPTTVNEETLVLSDYQWAFGGDPYHVKLYNRSTGFAQTLTKDGDNAVMRRGNYTWDLLPNKDGFVLRVSGTDYQCINQFGGKEGSLQFWNNSKSMTDEGSTFRVEEIPVIMIANNYTRTYGEANPTFDHTAQGSTAAGTPQLSCEANLTSPVGTYPIVIEKGSVTNDKVKLVNGTLTITPAPLTITVNDQSIEEGEDLPQLTLTYEGFKNDETEDVLTKQPEVTTTATSDSAAGDYEIWASGGEATNYTITYVNGTLTITIPVGMATISKEMAEGQEIFDLSGRKLNSITRRGIYIVNGKKVTVK